MVCSSQPSTFPAATSPSDLRPLMFRSLNKRRGTEMLKTTATSTRDTQLCPSSQPGVEGARVLGVVQHTASGPDVSYLDQPLPATPDVLAMAGPGQPTEDFPPSPAC